VLAGAAVGVVVDDAGGGVETTADGGGGVAALGLAPGGAGFLGSRWPFASRGLAAAAALAAWLRRSDLAVELGIWCASWL
jgi:hypothetical protein